VLQIVGADFQFARGDASDRIEAIDPHETRAPAIDEIDLSVARLRDRWPEIFVVQREIGHLHPALRARHRPRAARAHIAEQFGDEQPIGGEQIHVAHVAVDAEERACVASGRRDEMT